jgi:hypothetical protein
MFFGVNILLLARVTSLESGYFIVV